MSVNIVTHLIAHYVRPTSQSDGGSSSSQPSSSVGGVRSDFARLILHSHPRPGSTVNRTA